MKVLIADDNDASCKLLRALLEADGHAVIVTADGRQALELLEHYPVDAIISDLRCPIWTGSDFAGRFPRIADGTGPLLSVTPRFTVRWTMKSWPLIWGQMPICASPLQGPLF